MTEQNPMYGVNLGGWLVLEKWMTPSLFKGTTAVDEYSLCTELASAAAQRLDQHRRTFVTEADFAWLAGQGIQAVRLPVGYWLFTDEPPFISYEKYVRLAFDWASKYKLRILLDVHAVPGSQNGQDHSGRIGEVDWYADQAYISQTLQFVERLAREFGHQPALLGIELLNEPSWRIPKRTLKTYYQQAYKIIREYSGQQVWVVFNPYSMAWRWRHNLRPPLYGNVLADVHAYQCFSKRDKRRSFAGHVQKLFGPASRGLRRITAGHPVIVGEWSLTLPGSALAGSDRALVQRAYADAQLVAYSQAAAWFFWSYKTEGGGSWSFRDCTEKGWLPDFKNF